MAKGARARRLMVVSALLAGAIVPAAPTRAQVVSVGRVQYQQRPTVPLVDEAGGRWLGPYDLEPVINPDFDPQHPVKDNRNWAEITHAILLPPASDSSSLVSNRVLLVCRRYDTGTLAAPGGDTPVHTFIWDRAQPQALTTLLVDPDRIDGSDELFCSGHTLTAGGNVLFVGGTDQFNQTLYGDTFWGQRLTHLFMNKQEPYWVYQPEGMPPEQSPVPDMQRDRWYPTAIRLADKSILVTGHGYNPVAVPDSAQTRERCDVDDVAGTVTWRHYDGSALLNNLSGSGCGILALVDLQVYPRMHQLVSGDVFASLSQTEVLRLNACTDPANPDRWSIISSAVHPAPDAATVHYIDLTPATGTTEVIYTLGGSVEGTHTLASNRVLRMDVNLANPDASTWVQAGVPQLNEGRLRLHVVILLDGSLLAIGGASKDPGTRVEVFSYSPERFAPPGIFAAPDAGWSYVNAHAHERTYHQVSLLLPSGEVLCGGGQGVSVFADGPEGTLVPVPPWYSVEVYRPGYLFQKGRPTISTVPTDIALGALDVPLGVKLRSTSSGGETRVALIGPGSVTHAMDPSQVYIKLKFAPFTPAADPESETTIHFEAPPDANVAPPGWYLLTVVNAEGRPAAAKWVRVGMP